MSLLPCRPSGGGGWPPEGGGEAFLMRRAEGHGGSEGPHVGQWLFLPSSSVRLRWRDEAS